MAVLPVVIAVVLGVVVLVGLVLAVLDLFVLPKTSRVKCRVNQCLTTAWQVPGNIFKRWEQRTAARQSNEQTGKRKPYSLIGFPRRVMALVLLGVLMSFVAIYSATLFRSPAVLGVQEAGLSESTAPGSGTTYATPIVGTAWYLRATLNLPHEQMAEASVGISGPSSIVFSSCFAFGSSGPKVSGYARGPLGRIALEGVGAADTVTVECRFLVVHRVRVQEVLKVELATASSPTAAEKILYLEPPDGVKGQEAAEAQSDKEIRTSPALWEASSIIPKPGAFKEQGGEWPMLDPRYPHGFFSEPKGRTMTLPRLEDTRVQSSKIVTLSAVITSHPVTQERFKVEGSGRQAIRQVYAIGQSAGERGGWCTTTRSTSQRPLRAGDHLKLRAAVVEWGRSQDSGGIAVMLNCPAVKILGSAGEPGSPSSSGAATVPNRFDH
jgi:hypothetical protein